MKRLVPVYIFIMLCGVSAAEEPPEPSLWSDVVRLYEQAKTAGETASKDVYSWLREDVENIGDWEYKIETIPEAKLESRLNELGGERWEAIWIEPLSGSKRITFKRSSRTWINQLPLGQLLKLAAPSGGASGSEG